MKNQSELQKEIILLKSNFQLLLNTFRQYYSSPIPKICGDVKLNYTENMGMGSNNPFKEYCYTNLGTCPQICAAPCERCGIWDIKRPFTNVPYLLPNTSTPIETNKNMRKKFLIKKLEILRSQLLDTEKELFGII